MSNLSTLAVEIRNDDNVERSIKKFKRLCESYGIVKEYKKRKEYRKPSVRMKEKLESAEKRRRKNIFKFSKISNKI